MTGLVAVPPGGAAYAQLRAWLDAAALATADMADGAPRYFALPDANGDPAAFGGLAGNGPDLLLRSLVVHPAARRSGIGARLVAALEGEARAKGGAALWLLTEGAAPFFTRLGFTTVERATAPPSIAASSQLQGLCPATAALMRKPIDGVTA